MQLDGKQNMTLYCNIYVTDYFFVRNHQKTKSYRDAEVQLNTLSTIELEESELSANVPTALLPWKEKLNTQEAGLAQSRFGPAGNRTQIVYPITDH
jgi:hypothetical protein